MLNSPRRRASPLPRQHGRAGSSLQGHPHGLQRPGRSPPGVPAHDRHAEARGSTRRHQRDAEAGYRGHGRVQRAHGEAGRVGDGLHAADPCQWPRRHCGPDEVAVQERQRTREQGDARHHEERGPLATPRAGRCQNEWGSWQSAVDKPPFSKPPYSENGPGPKPTDLGPQKMTAGTPSREPKSANSLIDVSG